MTKKHFVAMAAWIRQYRMSATNPKEEAHWRGAMDLALMMGRTFGPNFDVDRFKAAVFKED